MAKNTMEIISRNSFTMGFLKCQLAKFVGKVRCIADYWDEAQRKIELEWV